jgi:hypothetical protein
MAMAGVRSRGDGAATPGAWPLPFLGGIGGRMTGPRGSDAGIPVAPIIVGDGGGTAVGAGAGGVWAPLSGSRAIAGGG